jgi:steroid 5-alpha reductase family enzyme
LRGWLPSLTVTGPPPVLDLSSYTLSALAVGGALFLLWLLSLRLRDSSIVDIFWGLGFVLVVWVTRLSRPGAEPRAGLVAALTTLWGVRLAGYLAWRNIGKGEDRRYTAMRDRHGARWPLLSLFQVFLLQGVLLWVISLPVQAAERAAGPGTLGWLDALGATLVIAGVLFEGLGDFQLARFKAAPENRGQVMDRGLWRYTRHPNYFGDFLVWWGLYGLALAGGNAWTVGSPALMSFLLLRVSGVTLLEKSLRRRPGYDDYVKRTSTFFPWPPKTRG